jgi:hypothetical protein
VNSTLNMSLAKDPSQMMYRAVGIVELWILERHIRSPRTSA